MILRRFAPLAALAALGCQAEHGGTAVGNPTLDVQVARGDGIVFGSARLPVSSVQAVDCAGVRTAISSGGEIDLLEGAPIALPEGEICGIELVIDKPMLLAGSGAGGTFSGAVFVPPLSFDAGRPLGGDRIIEIARPGWMSDASLGLSPGAEVRLGPALPGWAALLDAIASESAMFQDPDGDGEISAQERGAGPSAIGVPEPEGDTDEDEGDDTDEDEGDDTDEDEG